MVDSNEDLHRLLLQYYDAMAKSGLAFSLTTRG